jgi:hypothetical protein
LNELSRKLESNKKSLLINTNDEIGSPTDSLEASDNGQSDDWCRVNDSVSEVSTKPNDDKKSVLTVTDDDIAICSEKESSFENEKWNRDRANGG